MKSRGALLALAIGLSTITSCATPAAIPALSPASAPVLFQPNVEGLSNIYIGSLHAAHTLFGDGGTRYPLEFYDTFRPYWDWISTCEHNDRMSPLEWWSMIDNAEAFNDENFVSLFGYEHTSNWGHIHVVFENGSSLKSFSRYFQACRISYLKSWDPDPSHLFAFLADTGGLATFAHPSKPESGAHVDFTNEAAYRNDDIARLAGIVSQGNIHWQNDRGYTGGLVKTALDLGYRLGFVAEPDYHFLTLDKDLNSKKYSYTGTVANSLTQNDIFESLEARHTYAVLSPYGLFNRIFLKAISGNHMMGDIFTNDSNTLSLTLLGETDLPQFTLTNLYVNGEIVESRNINQSVLNEKFNVALTQPDNYLFFEVRAPSPQGPDESVAFTSPMYVSVRS